MLATTRSLVDRGIDYQMIAHSPTSTAREVSAALQADIYDVLKTVAIRTRQAFSLAVVRGVDKIDLHLVKKALGDPHARLATDEEIAVAFPDFDPGCLPPIGSVIGIETLVDPSVFGASVVIFSAGRANLSVKASAPELFDDETVRFVAIRKRAKWEEPTVVRVGDETSVRLDDWVQT